MNLDLTNIATLQNTSPVNGLQAPGVENASVQNPDAQVPSFEAMLVDQSVEQHEPQLLSIEKSAEVASSPVILSPAPASPVVMPEEIALDSSFASPLLEAFQVAQNPDVKPNQNPGLFLVRPSAELSMPVAPISPAAPKLIDDASILSLSEFDDASPALLQAPPVDEQTFEQYWMDDDAIEEQLAVQYNFGTNQIAEKSDSNIQVFEAIPVLDESEFKPLPFDKTPLAADTKQQVPEEVATEITPAAFNAETEIQVDQEVKNRQLIDGIKAEITRMPVNQQVAQQLPSERTLSSLGTSLSLQGAEIAFNQPHKSLQNNAVVALSGDSDFVQILNTEGDEFVSEIAKSLNVKSEGEFKVASGQKEVLPNIPEQKTINIPKTAEYREVSAIAGEVAETEFENALQLDADILEGGVVKSVPQDSAKLYGAKFESDAPKLVEAKQIVAEKIIQGVKQQATQLEFTVTDPNIGKVKISFEYVPNSATQEVAAIKIEADKFSTFDDLSRARSSLESIVKSNVNMAKDCELSFSLKDFSTSTSSNQEFKHNFKGNESHTPEQFENYIGQGQEIIEQRMLPYMTVNSMYSNVGGVSIFA